MFIFGIAGTFVMRSIVNRTIVNKLADGISHAHNEIARKIYLSQLMTIVTLITTLIMFLVVIYIFPFFFSEKVVIGSIYTIYASILLGVALFLLVRVLPNILIIIFKYKFNIKDFIYDLIYEKIYDQSISHTMGLSFFSSIMNSLFGKSASEIAADITDDIFPATVKLLLLALLKMTIAIAAYIGIFVWLVQPVLADTDCGSSWYQLFLCPFVQSAYFMFDLVF